MQPPDPVDPPLPRLPPRLPLAMPGYVVTDEDVRRTHSERQARSDKAIKAREASKAAREAIRTGNPHLVEHLETLRSKLDADEAVAEFLALVGAKIRNAIATKAEIAAAIAYRKGMLKSGDSLHAEDGGLL